MTQEKVTNNPQKEDLYSAKSTKSGFAGFMERTIRRFRSVSFYITLSILYLLILFAMGISVTPGVSLFLYVQEVSGNFPEILKYLALGCAIVVGFFLYGLSLIFVVPLFNFLMPFRVKPFRGNYYSLSSIPWYFHNAFIYAVRYTFLEFFTPTPLNILFYRLMGMKIGKHSHINTTNISDAALIEIGDKVTIGGSATIFAHYASKGYLVVERVKISNRATIGIKATVMGDVEIGKGVMIAPHEVVMPKTRIPDAT